MQPKFLSVTLSSINHILTGEQINRAIHLQNELITLEIETRSTPSERLYQSPYSTDLTGLLRDVNQVLYLALDPLTDMPIGIAVAEPHPESTEICGLLSVSVDNSYRRTGVGTKLIEKIKGELMENGFKEIVLYVDLRNSDAVDFYNSLGFKLTVATASLEI